MFRCLPDAIEWRVEQKTYEISGTVIGGSTGLNPTLLVGSMFYVGDKLVHDHSEGVVDRDGVKKLIEHVDSIVKEHGLSYAIDVVASTCKAIRNYLNILSELTNAPLMIDSPEAKVRIEGYKVASELGITDRIVVNAIYVNTSDEELNAIKDAKIKSAILMAYDFIRPINTMTPDGKLKVLRDILLPKAEKAGISNILVDTGALDPGSLMLALLSIRKIKNELGYPTGCAPVNAIENVIKHKLLSKERVANIYTAIVTLARAYGADFIFYGPLKWIDYIVDGIAIVDSYLAYILRLKGLKVPKEHPMYKLLPKLQISFIKA